MTLFKICGLRELDHALTAADSGASFISFNFVPGVRRQVSRGHARKVIEDFRRLRNGDVPRVVGLFASQPVEDVNSIVRSCGLDLVQLCGDEPPKYWEAVEVPVLKMVRVRDAGDPEAAIDSTRRTVAEIASAGHTPLLDTYREGRLGGTGHTFDWSIARAVSEAGRCMLAGGLNPENVGLAIETARPWAVDVSSGVETDGVKDPARIRSFADQVRRASDRLTKQDGR